MIGSDARALAAEFALSRQGPFRGQAPGLKDIDVIDDKRNPTKREIEKADRTGEAPARLRLQEILDTALDEPGTIFSFMDRLEAVGVTVRPNGASTGRQRGVSTALRSTASRSRDRNLDVNRHPIVPPAGRKDSWGVALWLRGTGQASGSNRKEGLARLEI